MDTLAMFVHGGYWRSLEPSMFSHMAKGLNARGIAVAVSGYDLAPQVSIADIIAQTQRACLYLWWRFHKRVMVTGHSAGGHLAACLLATDWTAIAPDVPKDLVPAAYAISGLFDLEPLTHLESNLDFKLDAESARRISPATAVRWRFRAAKSTTSMPRCPARASRSSRPRATPRRSSPAQGCAIASSSWSTATSPRRRAATRSMP